MKMGGKLSFKKNEGTDNRGSENKEQKINAQGTVRTLTNE